MFTKILPTKSKMKSTIEAAATLVNQAQGKQTERRESWYKAISESKGIQDLTTIADAKQHKQWNKKRKNTLDDVRFKAREDLEVIGMMTEADVSKEYHKVLSNGTIYHPSTRVSID